MHSTPQPPSAAATEHLVAAERLLAALPLVRRRADRDRHVQIALVHATLSVAASMPPNVYNTMTQEGTTP